MWCHERIQILSSFIEHCFEITLQHLEMFGCVYLRNLACREVPQYLNIDLSDVSGRVCQRNDLAIPACNLRQLLVLFIPVYCAFL
jgi:hypothetical protein